MPIKVVDIFAGAGGLGEGFSTFTNEQGEKLFKVVLSAEMDAHAAKTLRTRAFFHQFPLGKAPDSYYAYVRGEVLQPWTEDTREQWEAACSEAHQLTLGEGEHDDRLDQLLSEKIGTNSTAPWVLVGGPPCQAFSLAGRSRNVGIKDYDPAKDHRHFLYRHYLHIVSKYQPAVFILENVKGMLSSRVDGERMFPRIIADLTQPGGPDGPKYRVVPVVRHSGFEPEERDFLLRAEELGLPQARHRVVLMGIKEGVSLPEDALLQPGKAKQVIVAHALHGLPELRSKLTEDDGKNWAETASTILRNTAQKVAAAEPEVAKLLMARANALKSKLAKDPGTGGQFVSARAEKWHSGKHLPHDLRAWLVDERLKGGWLNHFSRGHMTSDLERYAYAAAFAEVHKRAPRGPGEFPSLGPAHKNWAEGTKFVDRFNVQCADAPSSTITSHLAKDGHYFIHPDFTQLRSLSVREAARLQTFPDNFFFEGPAGAQRKQVGNAVPPYLARQIASVVFAAINGSGSGKASSEN